MWVKKHILKDILNKTFLMFRFISKVEFFCFFNLLYIFILLIGTIEQKNFGLQFAQDQYFNSYFFMLFNFIPMFGGKLIFFLIFLSLTLRLIVDKWKKKRIGTIFLHVGVLFLLLGAFVNNKYRMEGHLIIKENNHNNTFTLNDVYELGFLDKKSLKFLKNNINFNFKNYPPIINGDFVLNVINFSRNCELQSKKKFSIKSKDNDIERFFLVKSFPSFVEQEENRFFLEFTVKNKNYKNKFLIVNYDDLYLFFENDSVSIKLSKKDERLPFNLYLSKFEKVNYSGIQKAKNYVSNLIIEKNDIIWKTKIEMNKPLRIGNYTLYQTSFLDGNEKSTILTVVENTWGFYPYVSTLLIFFGFFIHIFLSFKKIRVRDDC